MRIGNHKSSFEMNGIVFECVLQPRSNDKLPRYNFVALRNREEIARGQLFIKNEEVRGLVDIRSVRKGHGFGADVVKALKCKTPDMLIYDVKEHAREFWEKMGFDLVLENGLLMGVATPQKPMAIA